MAEVNRIAAVTMTGAERDTGERRPLVCLFVAGLLSEAPHRPPPVRRIPFASTRRASNLHPFANAVISITLTVARPWQVV
jgi:hypothetical protein